MEYSDCDPDRPTTPESRLRDALEADVARHHAEICDAFTWAMENLNAPKMWIYRTPLISAAKPAQASMCPQRALEPFPPILQ